MRKSALEREKLNSWQSNLTEKFLRSDYRMPWGKGSVLLEYPRTRRVLGLNSVWMRRVTALDHQKPLDIQYFPLEAAILGLKS